MNIVEKTIRTLGIGVETAPMIPNFLDTPQVQQNPLQENFVTSANIKTKPMIAGSKFQLFLFFYGES